MFVCFALFFVMYCVYVTLCVVVCDNNNNNNNNNISFICLLFVLSVFFV